jgi:hypothetical protein
MPVPKASPPKRLFTLHEVKAATTIAISTLYRYAALDLIKLVHIGSRTYMTAEELDRLVTGQIVLPSGHRARHLHAPQSVAIAPHRKRGRPRKPGPTETG